MSRARAMRQEGRASAAAAGGVNAAGDRLSGEAVSEGDSMRGEGGGVLLRRALRDAQADAPILELLARGERGAAFDLLARREEGAVYALCFRIVKNHAQAEDVKQKVLLQAYQGIETFAGGSSLRTWLLGIANYRSLDALRARRREETRRAPDDALLHDVVDRAANPAERAESECRRQALEACLASCLSAADRKLLRLYYHEGLSYEAIGAALGRKADTLRVRVARALPKLRRALEKRGVLL